MSIWVNDLLVVTHDSDLRQIQVTLVVQLMAPMHLQQYVHRVGRTARNGKEGTALLVLLEREEAWLGLKRWLVESLRN